MTEEEAKTKWCPQVRFNAYACNTDTQTPTQKGVAPFYACIASDCMMWVWDEDFTVNAANQKIGETNYNTIGHCGLAK